MMSTNAVFQNFLPVAGSSMTVIHITIQLEEEGSRIPAVRIATTP